MQALRTAFSTQIARGGEFSIRQIVNVINANSKFMYNVTVTLVIVTLCVIFGYTFAICNSSLFFTSPVPQSVDSVMLTLGAVVMISGVFEYFFKRNFGITPLKVVNMIVLSVIVVIKFVCVPMAPLFAVIAIAGFLVHKYIIDRELMLDYHMDVVSHISDLIVAPIVYCQRIMEEFINPSSAGHFTYVEKVSDGGREVITQNIYNGAEPSEVPDLLIEHEDAKIEEIKDEGIMVEHPRFEDEMLVVPRPDGVLEDEVEELNENAVDEGEAVDEEVEREDGWVLDY